MAEEERGLLGSGESWDAESLRGGGGDDQRTDGSGAHERDGRAVEAMALTPAAAAVAEVAGGAARATASVPEGDGQRQSRSPPLPHADAGDSSAASSNASPTPLQAPPQHRRRRLSGGGATASVRAAAVRGVPPSALSSTLASVASSSDSASSDSASPLSSSDEASSSDDGDGAAAAAELSHLPESAMGEVELRELPEYSDYQYAYCDIRNSILTAWHADCSRLLDFRTATRQLTRVGRAHARRIFQFLHRFGFINCGVRPTAAQQQDWPSDIAPPPTRPPRRVLVIGAGASGLAAASQLTAAGYQVTVVEGRRRLGGRVCTERQSAQRTPSTHRAQRTIDAQSGHCSAPLMLCAVSFFSLRHRCCAVLRLPMAACAEHFLCPWTWVHPSSPGWWATPCTCC